MKDYGIRKYSANEIEIIKHLNEKIQEETYKNPLENAFEYRKKMYEMGYFQAVVGLADCYKYGWGCEKDIDRALDLYFDCYMLLYDRECSFENMLCRLKCGSILRNSLCSYEGEDCLNSFRKNVIFKTPNFKEIKELPYFRCLMADKIIHGELKGYSYSTAFRLLVIAYDEELDLLPEMNYLLAECFAFGTGTETNLLLSKYLLEETLDIIEDFERALISFEFLINNSDSDCIESLEDLLNDYRTYYNIESTMVALGLDLYNLGYTGNSLSNIKDKAKELMEIVDDLIEKDLKNFENELNIWRKQKYKETYISLETIDDLSASEILLNYSVDWLENQINYLKEIEPLHSSKSELD